MAERSRLDRQQRADRNLDSARDLLLRWGYRRVTIDESAARARYGKGTIDLHWRSREEIFHAVSAREAAAMTQAIVDAVRKDPGEVVLHRYLRRLFVEAMERPVLRALGTRDADTLDKFLAAANHQRRRKQSGRQSGLPGCVAARGRAFRPAPERPGLHPADDRVRFLCGGTISAAALGQPAAEGRRAGRAIRRAFDRRAHRHRMH